MVPGCRCAGLCAAGHRPNPLRQAHSRVLGHDSPLIIARDVLSFPREARNLHGRRMRTVYTKSLLSLVGVNARDGFLSVIEMMQQSARLMGMFMPARGLFGDWPELDNKIEAFRLFQSADRELRLPVDRLPLDEVVQRALAGDAFRAIWMLEGVGYIKATASSLNVKGLLTEGPGARLPDRAMIPLHAGMGTAFGEKLFGGLGSRPSRTQVGDTVQRFVDACRANCRPGWEDACIESAGLTVRLLYPSLVAPVSAEMEIVSPALRPLFWHGVGRSLYFQPMNFLPIAGAHRRMLNSAAQETSPPEDRRNVLAGLAWAVTLVNLPQPAVIRSLASVCSELKMRDEFIDGLISALLVWRHMAPDDSRYINDYTRPLATHDRQAILWNQWIETPAREALANFFPGLERRNNIPSLYTFRTSDELSRLSEELVAKATKPKRDRKTTHPAP
jgi:hypothetical protein